MLHGLFKIFLKKDTSYSFAGVYLLMVTRVEIWELFLEEKPKKERSFCHYHYYV